MTGVEFKAIRESLGLSQQEMADRLGCSKRTVLRYENGDRVVTGEVAAMVTEWVGIGDRPGDQAQVTSGDRLAVTSKVTDSDRENGDRAVTACAECETQKLLVAHWQSWHDSARDEINSLRARLADLESEIDRLRSAAAVSEIEDDPQPEPEEARRYSPREFVDACCKYLKSVTGEAVNRSAVETGLRSAKIGPQEEGPFRYYSESQLERFKGLVQV